MTASFPGSITQLETGLTVVHHYLPQTTAAIADVWIKAGSQVEHPEWLGAAHFLEHLIFKGTATCPPGEFDRLVESYGAITNAATSYDYAHYYVLSAAEQLEATLPALADLLLNAAIPEGEFERERQVVLEEIREAQDDPDDFGFQALLAQVYPQHPYGQPILGTPETLLTRSAADLRAFHQHLYQPQNMTVVMVGQLEQQACLDLVARTFAHFPSPSLPVPPRTESVQSDGVVGLPQRQTLGFPNLMQPRLLLGWAGPGIKALEQACALDVLTAILTGGRTSRLVKEFREERQLVHDIDSALSLQQRSSLFTITAWLDSDSLEVVETLIYERLAELRRGLLTERELQRAQRLLINDFIFSTETAAQLSELYGYYSAIATPELAFSYPDYIRALTMAEIASAVEIYLQPAQCRVTILNND
ncbi:MAG: pitrilysin family protein [Cyanobacteria bacterium P01_H01_bin.121]